MALRSIQMSLGVVILVSFVITLVCLAASGRQRPTSRSQSSMPSHLGEFDSSPDETRVPVLSALDAWLTEQARRQQLVAEVCNVHSVPTNVTSMKAFKFLLADDRHHLLYCYVPKVGCTSWKTIMVSDALRIKGLGHFRNIHNRDFIEKSGLHFLNKLTPNEVAYKLMNYKKFMFVREPLERFVSAYRDKFEGPGDLYHKKNFGRTIIQRYRAHPTNHSLKNGDDVTFNEFSRFVLDQNEESHWMTQQELCSPCHIQYDFIGKYETFETDTRSILQILYNATKEEAESLTPALNVNHDEKTSSSLVDTYLRSLPKSMVEGLIDRYAIDSKMFNYRRKYV